MLDRAAARARLSDAIAADYITLAQELIPAYPAPPGHRSDMPRRQELHWWGGDVVESTRYGASVVIRREGAALRDDRGEYPALYRSVISVEAEGAVAACPAAVALADRSDAWTALDWEQPTYVVALAPGADVDPWQRTLEGADTSVLPVPGLFTDVAQLAGYAATRSEDLVLQLRIMLDAIGVDGRPRIDPKALVRLCATGRAMLKDIEAFGLPPVPKIRGASGPAVAVASPGTG